ncbi:MAG: molybdopterin cofactor-binding domain-containing protein, partial [Candidatus Auribacterota bacterium]|nr:molybdopterin cofactor-binding domain-containing protein [Candidatus Auribacterota bacterium]
MDDQNQYRYIGESTPRIDAWDKVTGKTKYPTDYYPEGMLRAKVLRSRYPHAKLLSIDIEPALGLPGVIAVLTHRDIPGHNGFGIIGDNWPVLCSDRVRYRGDAIALIAAIDEETAKQALSLIKVEYEPLPVVDTPEDSLKSDAPLLHRSGNVLYENELNNGVEREELEEFDQILQSAYSTPYQEHAFLETEGGMAVYDDEAGVITIRAGDQDPYRDRLQVARALNWDPEKIRMIGSPTGGAFGGKNEISVQIHLALLAYYTRRPVRLHLDRSESIITGEKRHPMSTNFHIGVREDGSLQSFDLDLTANAGAYDGITPAVLNLALECSPGGYRFPRSRQKGRAVYTNSAMGGSFRSFGVPQVTFGLEQELDRLSKILGIDPIELRLRNAIESGDLSANGQRIPTSVAFKETLLAARKTELWREREDIKSRLRASFPEKKFGVGLACTCQGIGMGKGIPDYTNIEIEIEEGGSVVLRTSAVEIGQGNLTAYAQILAEALDCNINDIEVIHGDSGQTPDSGPVVASRSVMMVGNAILNAVGKLEDGDGERPIKVTGSAVMPVSDRDFGAGIPHIYFNYLTQIALVGVDTGTGLIELLRVITIPDAGQVINRAGFEGQCEGAVVQGQGYALSEEVLVEEGEFKTRNFSTYIIPTALDIPDQETIPVESREETGPFGAKGIGEAPLAA